jgi:hypothetical protein
MDFALAIATLLVAASAVWLAAVAWRGISIPLPPASQPRPCTSREEALARLLILQSAEDDRVNDACRTVLLEPSSPGAASIVIWHGFTNAPPQFLHIAEALRQAGYPVLLARMPRHGLADVLNRDLLDLTATDLTEHVDECLDIAAGLAPEVWVVGLSAGGVLAGWSGAFRKEVRRVAVAAPFAAPKAIPYPLVRLMVKFRRLIPAVYFWWDPRKKADLGESPYVYPGFPLPGMLPFLQLAESLHDRRVRPINQPDRVVLISNPGDFAIRRDVARELVFRTFGASGSNVFEATIDEGMGWWHDFVDPWGPHIGTAEQTAAVFFAALGIGNDPSALGTITDPYPPLSSKGGEAAA